jgi:hypothetical protein
MIRISPGDLLQISNDGKFFYALVLDKIRLFGGQLAFGFYQVSTEPLAADEVLSKPFEGFYETVDFINANREKRLERIAKHIDVTQWSRQVTFFKQTFTLKGKASEWWICDRNYHKIKRTPTLTEEEKRYPFSHCIGIKLMLKQIEQRWSPENDPRI